MNIALIAPTEIPALRANTIQVMKMAQAFCDQGHQVYVITPQSRGQSKQFPSDLNRSWDNLADHYGLRRQFPIVWLDANPRWRRYDFSLKAIHYAQKQNCGAVYTRLPQVAALASQKGLKTVYEIHDFPQGKMGPFLLRLFLRGRGAQRLVVITRVLASDLGQSFDIPHFKKFVLIAPDGVDLERYQNLPEPEEARQLLLANPPSSLPQQLSFPVNFKSQFTLGYTGHLYPGRGLQLLIELATHFTEINFLIIGGEPEDVIHFQRIAQTRNLKNLLITGFIPNAELPRFQAACDGLLMPYQAEVSASSGGNIARYLSPMKLFEYMASQRAILSSDLPVLQEILHPKNAILLPPNDIQAWIKAITTIKDDPELSNRLAKQARQDVSQYTWQARASQIMEGLDA